MESNNDNVKRGVWTPWAQVLCYECHGNENLPDPKTDAEWARMIEPVPLMEEKAVTFCDSCHTDIQVYDSVAYEHNLVKALRDHGFEAVMAQTGGMMSGCSITPPEDLQKNGEPDGIGEILITYNDSGDNLYWMGVYDNDFSPADVEWGNISFQTQDEVINWAYSNQEKIAKLDAPKLVTYKGIPLEGLDKHVSMAHSHFIGSNEGIDYLTALLSRDKQALTPKQFEAMSALNSVAVMNYQICNGGLDQYYFNQCHKEREPFSENDVKLVDKDRQVEMLRELHAFGREVFPERAEDNEQLGRIIGDFDESGYTEPAEGWLFDEEEEGGLDAPYDFDDRYYEVNDFLETLIESYAQYLDKSIEKSLDELVKEAKAKAAEKNADRKNPPQQDFKGVDR